MVGLVVRESWGGSVVVGSFLVGMQESFVSGIFLVVSRFGVHWVLVMMAKAGFLGRSSMVMAS